MRKNGPIVIIEDDLDDQQLLKEVFEELKISNVLRFFHSCVDALTYLLNTMEKPFLILSDINLPAMTGIQLKEEINRNAYLKNKCIPFVFLSTTDNHSIIAKTYEFVAQGYFVKPTRVQDLREMVRMIIDYWKVCRHPGLE